MEGDFRIAIVGDDGQGGTYVLRIRLQRDVRLRFGGFRGGKEVGLRAGEYAYVGSALAEKGATSLARRLLRHATRSGRKRPHAIGERLLEEFRSAGLGGEGLAVPASKKLRWNVDYLLDLEEAEVVGVLAVRSKKRLEDVLADRLEKDAHTAVIERGLGAADAKGRTHLLRVERDEAWWEMLVEWVGERL